MTDQKKAYLLAIIAALLWSTAASAFKISLRYISYPLLLFFSSLTAFLVLLIIIILKGKFRALIHLSKEDLNNSILLGFLNPFLYYIVLFKAYNLIPAQQAQPLNFIWPVVLVILSIPLLKQKIRIYSLIALIICFSGVVFISTQGDFSGAKITNPLGIGLALFSAIVWALFWIYNLKDRREELYKLTWSFLFGSIFTFSYIIMFSDFSGINLPGLAGCIYIGIFEMGLTFYIWLNALKLSRSTAEINTVIYLTPLLALLFIHLTVGEDITYSTLIGVILIISGIFLNHKFRPKGL